ncbi:MAG: hypothetical protein M3N08_00815 [Pseudomonadota bacterium]|nr:hypothetical protein [Pseudomonadota bacterium]
MADQSHAAHPAPPVPAELVDERRHGWHAFTRMMFWNAVATAAVLIVLLLVFKIF